MHNFRYKITRTNLTTFTHLHIHCHFQKFRWQLSTSHLGRRKKHCNWFSKSARHAKWANQPATVNREARKSNYISMAKIENLHRNSDPICYHQSTTLVETTHIITLRIKIELKIETWTGWRNSNVTKRWHLSLRVHHLITLENHKKKLENANQIIRT